MCWLISARILFELAKESCIACSVRIPCRNVLAYPLAPLLGVATPSGSAPLVMVAIVGIIAAIAIPQFAQYRKKADNAALDFADIGIQAAAHSY